MSFVGPFLGINGGHRIPAEAVQLAVLDEDQGLTVGRPRHGGMPVEGLEQGGAVSTGDLGRECDEPAVRRPRRADPVDTGQLRLTTP